MTDLLTSIGKMTPNGNRLELPQDDHFANYAQVKQCLLTAGGKYKRNGFEFSEPAAEIQVRLLGGEAINDKKKYQFFPTPLPVVHKLLVLANITPQCRVLEPSAGRGAIADAIRKVARDYVVVELAPHHCRALRRRDHRVIEGDFLALSTKQLGAFDRIVANPPFAKYQDVDHIRHMHTMLKPGGRLVSIASPSWTFTQGKKPTAFRMWLKSVGAKIVKLPAGAFKKSGTVIRSVIVVIDKPESTVAVGGAA